MSLYSSSGCGGTGFQGGPSTAVSRAGQRSRCAGTSEDVGSLPTGSPARTPTARSRDALRRARTSFGRGRASSRSPLATTSARGCSRDGIAFRLTRVIVPGQRLVLPRGARSCPRQHSPRRRDAFASRSTAGLGVYGVDPQLARALAWMESGFQHDVVSSVGAIGVMQLLPETWEFVDTVLLGIRTPRNYQGNVRAGVRYLRWQLDEFGGDGGSRSRAGTRERGRCGRSASTTTRSSSCASCSSSTARSDRHPRCA